MNLLSVLLLLFTVSSAFAQYCDCGRGRVWNIPRRVVTYPAPQVFYPGPYQYYPVPNVHAGSYRYRRELRRRKRCTFHCGPFGSG